MENFNETSYRNPFEEKKRPGFLTFLCILTFIGSGSALLSNLITPPVLPIVVEALRNRSSIFTNFIETYEQMLEVPVWQYYFLAFFCATAILGAIYMLKMKKIGFHIYAVSQIAQICIGQFLMGGPFKPNALSLFGTILFIGLYSIYYKKFTELDEENSE